MLLKMTKRLLVETEKVKFWLSKVNLLMNVSI